MNHDCKCEDTCPKCEAEKAQKWAEQQNIDTQVKDVMDSIHGVHGRHI